MAKNVTLTIALPTTRQDGTAVSATDIAHINVYRATGSAAPVVVGTVAPASGSNGQVTFTDPALAAGSYGYQVSGVDSTGVEGAKSDLFPVVIAAPPAPLSAPTIISAVAA